MRSAPALILAAALAIVFIAACTAPPGSQAPGDSDAAQVTGAPAMTESASRTLQVSAGNLALTATVDSTMVAPYDMLSIRASVSNSGSQPAVLFTPECGGAVSATAAFGLPLEPYGKQWSGTAGALKEYVLSEGYGPGAVPATSPMLVELQRDPCLGGLAEVILEPGEVSESTLIAPAELIKGVPAITGMVPITVQVLYLLDGPASQPAPSQEVPGGRSVLYTPLTLKAEVAVERSDTSLASVGEVIDSVLADPTYLGWLEAREPSTWANANLFLIHVDKAAGIVPAGSWWELDLFREVGAPRDSAIAFINPFDASLHSVSYCHAPCD